MMEHYNIDPEAIETEMMLWHWRLEKLSVYGVLYVYAIDKCHKDLFTIVFKCLQIFATLPVSTCEPKRSFCSLK